MKKIVYLLLIINCTFNLVDSSSQWVNLLNLNKTVRTIAYSQNNIYAAIGTSTGGFYLSTNNGMNWTQKLSNLECIPITISGSYIFTGTMYSGVFMSSNNGTNWTQTSLNDKNIISLASSGNKIYVGPNTVATGYGVQYTTNYGANWVQTSLNNVWVISLAADGNYVYAGTSDAGVFVSTNEGLNWAQTLNTPNINALTVRGNNIFAGANNTGLYLSTNNGSTWTQTPLNYMTVRTIEVDGNNIYAGTFGNGVFVSNDFGNNWIQRNEGLGNVTVYSLCIINNYLFAGTINSILRRPLSDLTGITTISNEIPNQFSLSQNYPNPFNPGTVISFSIGLLSGQLSVNNLVSLKVYDLLGREVQTLINEQLHPGTYEVDWDGSGFSSGVYYYRLEAGNYFETKKMLLVK